MAFVCTGDIAIVESISCIARNTKDILSIVFNLTENEAEFTSSSLKKH